QRAAFGEVDKYPPHRLPPVRTDCSLRSTKVKITESFTTTSAAATRRVRAGISPASWMEVELDHFHSLVVGFFPFPFVHCALRRLHQQRISAFDLNRLEIAVGQYHCLQLHRSTQIQVSRYQRIHRNYLIGYLAR